MTGVIANLPKFQFFDNNGHKASGYKLYTYLAGTTTDATTWQDQALTQANTNPITLDSRGECDLWLDPAKEYKIVLKTPAGATIWTQDNVSGADHGLRAALAAASGASLVGFTHPGGDYTVSVLSALRTRRTPLSYLPLDIDPETTDCTAYIQEAIDNLPEGYALDGLGLTYMVRALKLRSNMALQNFRFLTKPGAVPAEYWSPVTIGGNGDTATYTDIDIINVHVDGNRVNNDTGSVGYAEDGGKHGFRVIGNVRRVNFYFCSAKYCGSYGFFFYRGLNTAPIPFDDVPTIEEVRLIDCISQWNKSHGGAADSVNEFTIDGGTYTHNGLDYLGDPGALTLGGDAYSNGWDFEGYGIGSWIGNVLIRNADMRHNASSSLLIQDPVLTSDPRFEIRDTIVIENIQADTGGHPSRLNPYVAINVTAPFANWTLGSIYQNVTITGGNIIGEINMACVDNMHIAVNQTVTRSILGEAAYCNNAECVTNLTYDFTNLAAAAVTHKRVVEYKTGTWTPTISSGSGAIGSYTSSGTYVKVGKQVTVTIKYNITNNGTGASYGFIPNLPYAANSKGGSGCTRVGGTSGNLCAVSVAGTEAFIWQYDNAYPWATGSNGSITLTYITD